MYSDGRSLPFRPVPQCGGGKMEELSLQRIINHIEKRFRIRLINYLRRVDNRLLEQKIITNGIKNYIDFDFEVFKSKVLGYSASMKVGSHFDYKFAGSTAKPTIYGSMYACLLQSLFGELNEKDDEYKKAWAQYFDSFQNSEDGFYYDKTINSDFYNKTDWWGKRHLIPHLIMAYNALGFKPKYQFKWVSDYYSKEAIDILLSEAEWNTAIMDDSDIDNKIMNIGVTLQYQRDYFNDVLAGEAVSYLKKSLLSKINPDTGMWGVYNLENPQEKARMIQFSYHLFKLFFYDGDVISNPERIIDLIIESQNSYGGFAASLNSGACADIDAVDPLVYLSKQTEYRRDDIEKVLRRAFIFILGNQNDDGGFVFLRDSEFFYGDPQTSSIRNESSLFPTWFRVLSIAYICDFLKIEGFNYVKSPGY